MIPNAYKEIFDKLSEKTSRGEVDWKPTSSESTFIVNFTGFSLSMTYGRNVLEQTKYVQFIIRDSEGMKVDSFTITHKEPIWDTAHSLFYKARQQALKIDKAIAVISEELDIPKKVGAKEEK